MAMTMPITLHLKPPFSTRNPMTLSSLLASKLRLMQVIPQSFNKMSQACPPALGRLIKETGNAWASDRRWKKKCSLLCSTMWRNAEEAEEGRTQRNKWSQLQKPLSIGWLGRSMLGVLTWTLEDTLLVWRWWYWTKNDLSAARATKNRTHVLLPSSNYSTY